MTNTIQQLKEEIMEEFSHKWLKMERDGGFMSDYPECPNDNSRDSEKVEKWVSTAIDKVIKATADAMVGEEIDETERFAPHVFGYNTRILEEKVLRDEITQ